jgi:hypothetical protein
MAGCWLKLLTANDDGIGLPLVALKPSDISSLAGEQ